MDYPPLDPGYSPEFLARSAKLAALFASKTPPVETPPPPPVQPNGILTDIGHGLAGGVMVGAPTMIGQALKAPGQPGDTMYDYGQSMIDAAKQREASNPLYQTTGAWGAGANMLASGLPALAAAPVAAALGAPAAAAATIGGLAGAGLFGASSFSDMYERAMQSGASPSEAHSAALKEAALMGVGQGVATAVGARAVTGTAGALARAVGIADKVTPQAVLDGFANPAFGKQVLTGAAENFATQLPIQAGVAGLTNQIEHSVGIDSGDSWEAAKATFAPTAAMTALMIPLGAAGTLLNNRAKAHVAETAASGRPDGMAQNSTEAIQFDQQREKAVRIMYYEMRRTNPEAAESWREEAHQVIAAGLPLPLDVTMKADQVIAASKEQPPTEPPAPPAAPVDQQEQAFRQLATSPASEGTLSFADFVRRARQTEGEGEPANAGQLTATGLKQAYVQYLNERNRDANLTAEGDARLGGEAPNAAQGDLPLRGSSMVPGVEPNARPDLALEPSPRQGSTDLRDTEQGAPLPFEHRNDNQGELDLQPKMNQRPPEPPPPPPGGGKTAMEQAFEAAGGSKKMEMASAFAQRAAQLTKEAEARKEATMTVAEKQARVIAANKLADDAMAGKITGNTPVASSDLARTWQQVVADEKLKVSTRAKNELQPVFDASEKKGLWANQLAYLQKVRDAMGASAKRDSMDALITKLKNIPKGAEDAAARANAVEENKGAKPEPAADQAGAKDATGTEQVAQGQGDANAGGGTRQTSEEIDLAKTLGAENALGLRQNTEGSGTEHPNGTEVGRTQVAGDSNRVVEGGQKQTKEKAAVAQRSENERAAKEAFAEKQLVDTTNTLATHERESQALQTKLDELKNVEKPTKEQKARTARVEAELAQRDVEGKRLLEARGEAMRVAEDAKNGQFEPAVTAGAYPFADIPWSEGNKVVGRSRDGAPIRGLTGQDRQNLHSYIFTKAILGLANKQEKAMLKNTGAGRVPTSDKIRAEAQLAMDQLRQNKEVQDYEARSERYFKALKLSTDMGKIAREREAKARAEAAAEDVARHTYMQELAATRRDFEAGKITAVERESRDITSMLKVRKIEEDNDEFGRGIQALMDHNMRQAVAKDSRAVTALNYIAANHRDPTMRAVAKLLASRSRTGTVVQVIDGATFNGARYIPSRDVIEVGRGGMNAITLMHESVHALAHRAIGEALIDQHREVRTAQQQAGVDVLRTLQKAMAKFRESADLTDPAHNLALQDEHEFLSEALANESIRDILRKQGMLTRIYNAIAHYLGFKGIQDDFSKLMDAAPAFFGDPRRDTDHVFQSAINREDVEHLDPKTRPSDGIESARRMHEKLALMPERLTQYLGKNDTKASLVAQGLRFVTLQHTQWLMDRTIARTKNLFPNNKELHDKLDALNSGFSGWKEMIDHRRGEANFLLNDKGESQDVQRHLFRQFAKSPVQFGKMTEMARAARSIGVHPADRTLAEAQKRNPKLTVEQFNHPTAKRAREAYADLQRNHPELAKTYDMVLQKHRLDFARYYGSTLENTLRLHNYADMPGIKERIKDLDWNTHKDLAPNVQEDRLNGAMRAIQGHIDDLHKNLNLQDAEGEAAKDSTLAKSSVDSLLGEYNRQRAVPYVHLGRTGDYHVGFTVRAPLAGEKEDPFTRIGRVVSADGTAGGLNRDWHEQIGDNRRVYMKFESVEQMNDAATKLAAFRKEGLFHTTDEEGKQIDSYYDGRVISHDRVTEGATPGFIRSLARQVTNNANIDSQSKAEVIRQMIDTYRQQLPETSPLKASMQADLHNGASKDFINTFGDRQTMSNQALVNVRASPKIAQTLSEMREAYKNLPSSGEMGGNKEKLAAYIDELQARAGDMQQPAFSPTVAKMKGWTAAWRLGMSPAYVAMTMYQPWQMTLPAIGAEHGMVKTAASMARNFGNSLAILQAMMKHGWGQEEGNNFFDKMSNMSDLTLRFKELKKADGTPLLDGETLGMLEHLRWMGQLNFGQTQQIFRTDPLARGFTDKTIRLATVLPHYAEVSNRITSALTAFEMARKSGKSVEEAQKYAVSMVRNTDGDHSQSNVARGLGSRGVLGTATPLAVGFQQYDFQMTEMLARTAMKAWGFDKESWQAQKQLLGVAVTTSLIAGTLGLPMMGMFTALANGLGAAFSDGNATPPDFQTAFQEHLNSMFGKDAGEIVGRGIPRAFDFDMSNRSGYQDLAPFSGFLEDRRKMSDRLKDGALNFMGPAVGVGAGLLTGSEAALRGDYVKAINDGLPAGVRNLAKAYRLSQYGYEQEGGNNNIPLPVNNWNVFMQAGGFVSGARAKQSEQSFAYNQNQELMKIRQEELRNRAYRAYEHGDYAEVGKIMQSNIDFAVQHPQFHADVAGGLVERAKQRAVGATTGGIMTNVRSVPFVQNYFPELRQ